MVWTLTVMSNKTNWFDSRHWQQLLSILMLKLSQIWPIGQSPFDISLLFFEGKPWYLRGKESACNVGDLGSIPALGRSPGEGNGKPLQCSYLENSMDRGAWWAPWGCRELDTTEQQLCCSLSTFLLSGTIRYPRLILQVPCPSSGISRYSKEPWFLSVGSGI